MTDLSIRRRGTGYGYTILVDGVDIGPHAESLTLRLYACRPPRVSIDLIGSALEVELPDSLVKLVEPDGPELPDPRRLKLARRRWTPAPRLTARYRNQRGH